MHLYYTMKAELHTKSRVFHASILYATAETSAQDGESQFWKCLGLTLYVSRTQ
jgi:hypothetical protein